MRTIVMVLALGLGIVVVQVSFAGPASAACVWKTTTVEVRGELKTVTTLVCTSQPTEKSEWSNVDGTGRQQVPSALRRDSNLDCPGVFLHHGATGGWVKVGEGCAPEEGQAVPVITMGMIASAFKDTPIPVAEIVVQPPGGKTLVNFETIFRTEADEFNRSFQLLGQRIQLRIRPSAYTWLPGDGSSFQTSHPGLAFTKGRPMSDYVTHNYEAAAAVHPRVNVTWTAEFRVGGRAWQPVTGSVIKQGPPANLRVVEGKPVLVNGY